MTLPPPPIRRPLPPPVRRWPRFPAVLPPEPGMYRVRWPEQQAECRAYWDGQGWYTPCSIKGLQVEFVRDGAA